MATSAAGISTMPVSVNPMAGSGHADALNTIAGQSYQNNAAAAKAAADQRDWTARQTQLAMDFNSAEAAKTRDWQQYMSNTAHQREVQDLLAAGLNPVLSASGGQGAAVGSASSASAHQGTGAEASTDMTGNAAIANILATIMSTDTQLRMTEANAANNLALADKYNATSELVSRISAGGAAGAARIAADAAMDRQLVQQEFQVDNPTSIEQWLTRYVSPVIGTSGKDLIPSFSAFRDSAIKANESSNFKIKQWFNNLFGKETFTGSGRN